MYKNLQTHSTYVLDKSKKFYRHKSLTSSLYFPGSDFSASLGLLCISSSLSGIGSAPFLSKFLLEFVQSHEAVTVKTIILYYMNMLLDSGVIRKLSFYSLSLFIETC